MIKLSKKSQSLVIQFILFFVIGFTIFITIGNFFKFQLDIFKSDITEYALKLTNSYMAGNTILMLSCKECDYASMNFSSKLNTRPDYIFEVILEDDLIKTSLILTEMNYISSVHNINELVFAGKSATSEPLTLTLDKTKNELRVD